MALDNEAEGTERGRIVNEKKPRVFELWAFSYLGGGPRNERR